MEEYQRARKLSSGKVRAAAAQHFSKSGYKIRLKQPGDAMQKQKLKQTSPCIGSPQNRHPNSVRI
jgi:hypothetical protein